jgi:hypothetical protein
MTGETEVPAQESGKHVSFVELYLDLRGGSDTLAGPDLRYTRKLGRATAGLLMGRGGGRRLLRHADLLPVDLWWLLRDQA